MRVSSLIRIVTAAQGGEGGIVPLALVRDLEAVSLAIVLIGNPDEGDMKTTAVTILVMNGVLGAVAMTTIVVIIPMKTLKTTGHPAITVPRDNLQNTRESMTPNPPDVVRESIAVRGHMTPERETTVAGEEEAEGIETEIETEIVRVSAEAANTRKRTRRRKRRNDARVLAVDQDRGMKRINLCQTCSLEK